VYSGAALLPFSGKITAKKGIFAAADYKKN